MPLRLDDAQRPMVLDALKTVGDARALADAVWLRTGLRLDDEMELAGGRNRVFTEAIQIAESQGWLEGMLRAAMARAPQSVPLRNAAEALGLVPLRTDAAIPDRPVAADDAALQALIARRRPPMLMARFAERLQAVSRAVCWIGMRDGGGDPNPQWGSGFLVAPDLILTNQHVVAPLLNAQAEPGAVLCRFDRLSVGAPEGEAVGLAESWKLAVSPPAPSDATHGAREAEADELDFALVRLERPLTRPALQVAAEPAPLVAEDFVFVVQHPAETLDVEEGAQRIAVGRVLGFEAEALRVRHDASATPGSSGSPALTADLQPAAIHQGTQPLRAADGSLVARVRGYNRAIPLRPVLKRLRESGAPAFWGAGGSG
ncbi:trypsin-like peptidase domain-containing protein [Sabulicella rubraurantiaca]|uniref:trypsin-like peptidase domain-containing protein n=1 Tax=Sabulicella rubraurantiaca TaxID=2811429 RepID=UPI001A958F0C|nr:trypsin-like peptidase domain-containing protein [Sabulicella rubraurantiaca]